MLAILKAGFYRLSKDWTFRITLIVGCVLAVFLNLLYLFVDMQASKGAASIAHYCSNGQSALLTSLSPVQNLGLTVPINLCIYVVNEFTHGTIRNKIIAGHKKSSIYFSMLLLGLVFTISLMTVYVLVSFGIGSIIGGFDPNGSVMGMGTCSPTVILQMCIISLAVYVFICSFAIFVVSIFRSIGPSLPVVIVTLLICYFIGTADAVKQLTSAAMNGAKVLNNPGIALYLDPLYTLGLTTTSYFEVSSNWFATAIIVPLYWAVIFVVLGSVIFSKRDIK